MAKALCIKAVNTAQDSENRIHDDAVAAEYGFAGGLVPGVTIYGYMASAAIDHFGFDWLGRGAMDVRFFSPFLGGEEVAISAEVNDGRLKIDAGGRASATAWIPEPVTVEDYPPVHPPRDRVAASRETIRAGVVLGSIEKKLGLSQPQVAAPLDAFVGAERFAHPAILLSLANEILMQSFVLGPWVHSSSEVRNFSAACDGEIVEVRAKIDETFERKGHELAVLDVGVLSWGRLVSRVRHTVIWQLRRP